MDLVIKEGTSVVEHSVPFSVKSGYDIHFSLQMDPVIEEGSSVAEHTVPFAVKSAYDIHLSLQMDPGMERRSAAEHTEIQATSDTSKHTVPFAVKSAYDIHSSLQTDPVMERRSDAEHTEIQATSDTSEDTEIEATSDGESLETEEKSNADSLDIEGSSATEEHTDREERTQWPANSIFRAPMHIRHKQQLAFTPLFVSIGPYYHGQRNFQRMENIKLRCIPEILMQKKIAVRKRNHPTPSEAGIPLCNRSIYNVPHEPSMQGIIKIDAILHKHFLKFGNKARAYYKEELKQSPINFVRILFIDSCFIIRTILSLFHQVQESMALHDVHIKDIRPDLLLLENQIPLFFIREVYEWLFPPMLVDDQNIPSFNTVLERFICLDMPWRINRDAMSSEAAHLLDLYWRCSLSPPMYMKLSKMESNLSEQEQPSCAKNHLSNNASTTVIANAAELHNMAGIKFEKFKDKGHLDVIFSNGIMRMPHLKIDPPQLTLLTNLIAFENCILPGLRTFTSYMKLMDALIDTEKDMMLLQKCGVIYNTLRTHAGGATFFNDIGNFCFIDYNTDHYAGLYKDVQEYYNSSWHCRWASLRYNYFSSPWAGISVIAGVTLLILSALQTYYTIYAYYMPKN